ncbi:hypothetical protein BD626DRAFT_85247 [Schizophyllum amplum]|uniref:Uncharacterized protein n=1 Tax=Schizophyllum amplum TaxID=97359 RepID=A0A550C957_9AGAR|nr:hypothetical protein BD626DRAFT_85247 [Auriculariopsis ampla]
MMHSFDLRNEYKCPISGAVDNLQRCYLIPDEAAGEDDSKVASREWVFGLPRGGLSYYLQSRENGICFRKDICQMYARGEFVLAPTFRLYLDALDFLERAGISNRKDTDRSTRRPLTALAASEGLYRYVFIPCTEAARALQKEFHLPRQNISDLNDGVYPVGNRPSCEGTEELCIVESYAHPFSIATFANKMLQYRSTFVSGQYHACVLRLVNKWHPKRIRTPQWFIDEPKFAFDDVDLTHSEANGYFVPQLEGSAPEPVRILHDTTIDDEDYRKRVSVWVLRVDPKSKPEPEPPRSPLALRRSDRLREKACPYASRSPPRCTTPLSPPRRVPHALRYRDPFRRPPAWTKRNGGFPTPRFCSNDWAFFRYHVALNAPRVT